MSAPDRRIDPDIVSPVRLCNYLLGGRDNFASDRAVGDMVKELYPRIADDLRATRMFHRRAVQWLVRVEGFTQILDLSCRFPTGVDTHDIAQEMTRDARVVYVSNEPLVMAYARALLTSHDNPAYVGYVEADLRSPGAILDAASATLSLLRPVAVVLIGVLDFLPDDDKPQHVVRTLMEALPAGSVLVATHACMDLVPDAERRAFDAYDRTDVPVLGQFTSRSKEAVEEFFSPLAFMGYPGVVPIDQWHPRFGEHRVSGNDIAAASEGKVTAAVYGGAAWKS